MGLYFRNLACIIQIGTFIFLIPSPFNVLKILQMKKKWVYTLVTVYQILNWWTSNIRSFNDSRWLRMTWDKIMTQSDLEWPRTAMEIVWMTQYDFRWVKSTSASPFWDPSDLNILIYSDSVTSQRETTILWGLLSPVNLLVGIRKLSCLKKIQF